MFLDLIAVFGNQFAALLALVAADVLLGVGSAIAREKFEWGKLAQFYRTMVIPKLLGWLAFVAVTRYVMVEVAGPEAGLIISNGVAWAAWIAVVTEIWGSIMRHVKEIYGDRPLF